MSERESESKNVGLRFTELMIILFSSRPVILDYEKMYPERIDTLVENRKEKNSERS